MELFALAIRQQINIFQKTEFQYALDPITSSKYLEITLKKTIFPNDH